MCVYDMNWRETIRVWEPRVYCNVFEMLPCFFKLLALKAVSHA